MLLVLSRFIPTHVGNTLVKGIRFEGKSVHPHACGEHFAILSSSGYLIGSSPRMWGTLEEMEFEEQEKRFIPTHVGNT